MLATSFDITAFNLKEIKLSGDRSETYIFHVNTIIQKMLDFNMEAFRKSALPFKLNGSSSH
jgi:hypothetical protein